MRGMVSSLVAAALAAASARGQEAAPESANAPEAGEKGKPVAEAKTTVTIETSKGTITAELWADKAPQTVANFLAYTDKSFYDGLIFHRVIPGFMVQGGGFTPDMHQKPANAPVRNEACREASNARGTLAMARTAVVDSATSQFFINLVDNGGLDHRNTSPAGYGYCVFGKVTAGMEVVDAIAAVPTTARAGHRDVPVEPVVIRSIRRAEAR